MFEDEVFYKSTGTSYKKWFPSTNFPKVYLPCKGTFGVDLYLGTIVIQKCQFEFDIKRKESHEDQFQKWVSTVFVAPQTLKRMHGSDIDKRVKATKEFETFFKEKYMTNTGEISKYAPGYEEKLSPVQNAILLSFGKGLATRDDCLKSMAIHRLNGDTLQDIFGKMCVPEYKTPPRPVKFEMTEYSYEECQKQELLGAQKMSNGITAINEAQEQNLQNYAQYREANLTHKHLIVAFALYNLNLNYAWPDTIQACDETLSRVKEKCTYRNTLCWANGVGEGSKLVPLR